MATRSERRRGARKAITVADGDMAATVEAQSRTIETLKAYCRDNKARLEHVAFGLQIVTKMLLHGDVPKALATVKVMNTERLAEAREAVGRREQSLDIAVRAMQKAESIHESNDLGTALSQVKALCPSLFEDTKNLVVAPVASA